MSRDVSSISWSRRGLLAAAGGLALPGCGFRPLHGEGGAPAAPATAAEAEVARELAAVRVAPLPERHGQLLRRELMRRLGAVTGQGTALTGVPARYELRVGLAFAAEPIGFRRDGTPSRVRTIGTATWSLETLATPPRPVTNGVERALDSYNIPENQFFAADVSREAMERRLIEQLAGDVTRRLAVTLVGRDTSVAGGG